jgi:hypothetical protein
MVATYSRDDLRAGRADWIAYPSLGFSSLGNRRLQSSELVCTFNAGVHTENHWSRP